MKFLDVYVRFLLPTLSLVFFFGCAQSTTQAQPDPVALNHEKAIRIVEPWSTIVPTPTPIPTSTPKSSQSHVRIAPKYETIDICLSNASNSEEHCIVSVDNAFKHPLFRDFVSLSPDGRKLLYVTSEITKPLNNTIWVASVEQAKPTPIAEFNDTFWSVAPIWSPDSSQIAYVTKAIGSAPDDGLQLWRMQVDGRKPTLVTQGGDFRPLLFKHIPQGVIQWGSDGHTLEFKNRWSSPPMLYKIDLATGKITRDRYSKESHITKQLIQPFAKPSIPCPVPLFNQKNYSDIMQPCTQSIARAGCAITAAAMMLSYYGVQTNPATLNTCLKHQACPIWWGALESTCSQNNVRGIAYLEPFNFQTLDKELAAGRPVIVFVASEGTHFVVVTGGRGQKPSGYTIHDPVDGSSNQTLERYVENGWRLEQMYRYDGQAYCPDATGTDTDGGTLSYGQIINGTIDPIGDRDDFFFQATEGEYIEIRIKSNKSTLDSLITLYDTTDALMVYDDDGGFGTQALLRGTIPTTGRYRIRVQGYGETTGNYTVQMNRVR